MKTDYDDVCKAVKCAPLHWHAPNGENVYLHFYFQQIEFFPVPFLLAQTNDEMDILSFLFARNPINSNAFYPCNLLYWSDRFQLGFAIFTNNRTKK
jgi:hypothetical protein